MYKPVILVILDGWGISRDIKGNAIKKASLPTIERLDRFYPKIALQASGISVGLPWGESGNSEVGHMTMGAGKIIYQNMPRITLAIQNGNFFKNDVFLKSIQKTKKNNGALHLMGLIGKGSVHSHIDHLYALLELAKKQQVEKLYLHIFTDGLDSERTSGVQKIQELQEKMKQFGIGKIATVSGRYFAMDRNNNWDRVEKSYDAMTKGAGERITDPIEYLRKSYQEKIFDEHIKPAYVEENGEFLGKIKEGDSVIFFNFREDRAKEITKAFVLPGFEKFKREFLKNLDFITMVQYEEDFPVAVAFQPIKTEACLGKIISKNNLFQLRISETEKFAHVSYFFNVGNEEAYPKEDRIIINSNSKVARYDEAPEMMAEEITEKVIGALEKNQYAFILINYVNSDIIAHTGNEPATVKALEKVDECLSKMIPAVLKKNGCLIITSDHGNAEELINTHTGETSTEHSTNPVPLWLITSENHREKEKIDDAEIKISGLLSDIAPTILELLEIPKPAEMTGESLLPLLR
jgi:2,3-bisphosphoglycerate-independent phosphoglycerate mutase